VTTKKNGRQRIRKKEPDGKRTKNETSIGNNNTRIKVNNTTIPRDIQTITI